MTLEKEKLIWIHHYSLLQNAQVIVSATIGQFEFIIAP